MGRFAGGEKRGRRETRDMVLIMGKHGNHNKHFERPFDTDDDVITYLREEGFDFDRLIEACRNRDQNVPRLENLISSEWTGEAPPGGYLAVKDERGDVLSGFTDGGLGKMTTSTYWSRFERAIASFDRCLETTSYEELLSSLSSGVSSIEAYIGGKAETHNGRHPEDTLVDSKQNKVSFDDKIKLWVPRMSGQRTTRTASLARRHSIDPNNGTRLHTIRAFEDDLNCTLS